MGSVVVLGLVGVLCVVLASAIVVGFARSAGALPDEEPQPEITYIDVEFTVYRPNQATVGTRAQLLFFAHLAEPAWDAHPGTPHPRVLVEELAAARVDEETSPFANSWAESDGPLVVIPELADCEVDPERAALGWPDPVAALEFRFTPRTGAASHHAIIGAVRVLCGDVELARIPLEVPVGPEPIEGLVPLDPHVAAPLEPHEMPPAPPPRPVVSWAWALAALLVAGVTVVLALGLPGPGPSVAPSEPPTLRVTPLVAHDLTVRLASGGAAAEELVVACPRSDFEVRVAFHDAVAHVDALPDGPCEVRFGSGSPSPTGEDEPGSTVGGVPVRPGDDLVCRLPIDGFPRCQPR